jgi:spore coat polysaccharide biosynthesis protein SpsF
MNNPIDAVLCARTQSSRLPGKPLLEAAGKTMLEHSAERLGRSRRIDRVVVATSTLADDEAIAEVAERLGLPCFQGDPDDVLDRVYNCAREYDMANVGIFGADNPLIDPSIVDHVAAAYLQGQFDYVTNNFPQTYPDGEEVEILSMPTLERIWNEATHERERAHPLTYVWEHPDQFSILNLPHEPSLIEERWTLDFPEDYVMLRQVIEGLAPSNPAFGMEDVLRYLAGHPDVRGINAMHADRYDWLGRSRSEGGTL